MKKFLTILLALFIIVGAFGCAAQTSMQDNGAEEPHAAPEESAVASSESGEIAGESGGGIGDVTSHALVGGDRKLVYRASLEIQTGAFESDYNKIIDAAFAMGGYVAQESTSGSAPEAYNDPGRTADLTLRIPVEKYDAFMKELSGVGKTMNKNATVDDITEGYYDTEARIEMLEMRYQKLEEHLKAATKMEDIIELEQEMSQILYELDALKGDKRHMDNQVAFSTVTVYLYETVKSAELPVANEDLGGRIGEAFSATLKGMGTFFEGLLVFLIAALPVLLVLAVIGGVVIWIVVGSRRAKRKKREQKESLPDQKRDQT